MHGIAPYYRMGERNGETDTGFHINGAIGGVIRYADIDEVTFVGSRRIPDSDGSVGCQMKILDHPGSNDSAVSAGV